MSGSLRFCTPERRQELVELPEERTVFDHKLPGAGRVLQTEGARAHHPGACAERRVRLQLPDALPQLPGALAVHFALLRLAAAVAPAGACFRPDRIVLEADRIR